jgi:RimJ/RimL family protein N-acetyltransferase
MSYIRWLWSDPSTMAPVGGPVHLSDTEAHRWFERMIHPGDPSNCYYLIQNENDQPIGEISYHHFDHQTRRARFNVKIAYNQRGNGYAHQAMRLFLDEFFNQRGGREIVDDVALNNVGGQRALLKFGFVHDHSVKDVYLLRLSRETFNRLYRDS